ncbi:hypothetical protein RhiirA4_468544 [Rhizophagus irregularis]|uniref:Uncharacterized protein n=1 Tax=Rhizophagus irregularis TaxID=588596 RepID=A0A2I1GXX0_9GLOM|nr:hypothetical protein RhiirA4_468544 [Rhizophagus irregularis]
MLTDNHDTNIDRSISQICCSLFHSTFVQFQVRNDHQHRVRIDPLSLNEIFSPTEFIDTEKK